ncbi:ATP-dependent DNA helicase [Achromobacter phage Motura]|uniref:ATP-dependent DNA helicase n=1 Tax=Achromobacter phage Motura TaxID=2591403 RepID=A0A514CSG2_9CAUD|nr:ATP-dependent DNA helicase [Achromobacter phage Motura]QDH83416.1 ATP-dependent DNA helicase [Achromobacter phage Motura]
MEKIVKIYKREAFLIKSSQIKRDVREDIERNFTFRFYEQKACDKCEFVADRFDEDTCGSCPAYLGGALMAKNIKIKENKFITTPIGNRKLLVKTLAEHGYEAKFVSKHPKKEDTAFKRPFKFTGKLRDFQPAAVSALIEGQRGVLKARPRSGKTVMSTAAICKVGKKTLILASQHDWLVGFYETFCGSKTQDPLTTARGSGVTAAERRKYFKEKKRANVGFCKTLEDFKRHDVCLATVQTFRSEGGQKLLRKIRDMFHVLVIDEVHYSAAPNYAKAISKLNVKYCWGLSGTPTRKDQRHSIMHNLIGPILFEPKIESLRPAIALVKTDFTDPRKQAQWSSLVNKLESDPKRLKLIAKWAVKDIENGHMVLLPFARIKVIKAVVMAINKIAGKKVAEEFHGSVKKEKRTELIEAARKYKVKCLVGQAKLLSTGINIPRASCIYDVTFSSNKENCEQRVARILTPYDGKPTPLLRIFMDNTGVRRGCLRTEFWQCIKPKFNPIWKGDDQELFINYLSNKDKDMEKW